MYKEKTEKALEYLKADRELAKTLLMDELFVANLIVQGEDESILDEYIDNIKQGIENKIAKLLQTSKQSISGLVQVIVKTMELKLGIKTKELETSFSMIDAYMARFIAKNVVANGYAKKCEIQVERIMDGIVMVQKA